MLYCKKLINFFVIFNLFIYSNCFATSFEDVSYAKITNFEVEKNKDNFYINIYSDMYLNTDIEQAIKKGLPISFILKAQVYKQDWYGIVNDLLYETDYKWTIIYKPFINKFKVSNHNNFPIYTNTLSEAINLIKKIKKIPILDYLKGENKNIYIIKVKLYIDKDKFPKLMQLHSFNNQDLNIDTGWIKFTILPNLK